jgi:hypothetical protein
MMAIAGTEVVRIREGSGGRAVLRLLRILLPQSVGKLGIVRAYVPGDNRQ